MDIKNLLKLNPISIHVCIPTPGGLCTGWLAGQPVLVTWLWYPRSWDL